MFWGFVLVLVFTNAQSGQLHGVIVNQAGSVDSKRIEQELSVLWYLDSQSVNANLVITEVFSSTASTDLRFLYDGVMIKKLKRSRRPLGDKKITSVVNEIYATVKKMDRKKRAAVMKKLIKNTNSSPAHH